MQFINTFLDEGNIMMEYVTYPANDSIIYDLIQVPVDDFKAWIKRNMPSIYHACVVTHEGTATRFFDLELLHSQSEAYEVFFRDNYQKYM